MKRIKSLDTSRGFCIVLMVWGHMLSWWVIPEDFWITGILHSFLGDLAAGGFLFVSGISAVIFFKRRVLKAEMSNEISLEQVKNEYLFRALIILIIALIFNSAIAIGTIDPANIWIWLLPLTIAFSLFLGFLFLRTSKTLKLILAALFWGVHFYLLSALFPYQGEANFFGIIYHILYNETGLHPILNYFSYFLIGMVVGDILFEVSFKNDQKERLLALKNKLWTPSLIMGPILIIVGILLLFPNFLHHGTLSSILYSLGAILTSFSILLIIEEYEVIKLKKNYRFFYFYSFYSLTIYFSHFIIHFFFLKKLNAGTIWIGVIGTFIVLTLLIRFAYKKYGAKVSVKIQVARISLFLVNKVEANRKGKKKIAVIK
jgi:uncharacterized membrane protein